MDRNKSNANAKHKLKDLSNNTDSPFDSLSQQPYTKGSKKNFENNTSVYFIYEGLSFNKTPGNQNAYSTQTSTPHQHPYPLSFPGPPPAHSGSYPSFSLPPPPMANTNVLSHIMQYITRSVAGLMTEVQNMYVSNNIKLDELCVENNTMLAAIAAGGSGSPGKGSKIRKKIGTRTM
ncbi:Hypothetical predicted protein [Mytilus galloprovincialis]|uniref:Uncharacterized protein n=1 Tax=Mytilus galloprovincialis TaxID=29158 RepID=A0A8B6DA38_MYTGA|nr:Hypothetical predicted protein [Mytilus galloprovincialis]